MRRAAVASALLVALVASPAHAVDQPDSDADEIAIVRTLTEASWERLVDALEHGPPRVHLRDTGTQFPGPTFVGDFDGGAGSLEVRWWRQEPPAPPVQVIYMLPAGSCLRLAEISRLWPASTRYFGGGEPGMDELPNNGLQLVLPDPGLRREVLYLSDPKQVECLREVVIHDTRVRGMTMEEFEGLRRQGAFDLPGKALK